MALALCSHHHDGSEVDAEALGKRKEVLLDSRVSDRQTRQDWAVEASYAVHDYLATTESVRENETIHVSSKMLARRCYGRD